MKKVYEITKYVVAENIEEALKAEKKQDADHVQLTKHSEDILLEELHESKGRTGFYEHMDGSIVCRQCEKTKREGCPH